MTGCRLQPGIYFGPGERPPPCFRLVLLDAAPGTTPDALHDALGGVFSMLDRVSEGHVRDLQGQPDTHAQATALQFSGLQVLIAFGRRFFDGDKHRPALTGAERPDFLAYLPSSDGPFPSLPWVSNEQRARGEADVLLQLTAPREAAVQAAAVEVWKLICDEQLPLEVSASFSGFGRPDGRGWLEFHDGVSNAPAAQRPTMLSAGADPPWMEGGTYLAFIRVLVDLERWRALSRDQQELVVGRDKLSGNALVGVRRNAAGRAKPVAAPMADDPSAEERGDWIDPPQTTDDLLEASHIHRANQTRASPAAPGGLRMFRQGFDFLDDLSPTGPRLGLNFVSFQRDLSVLQHVMHLPGWLGDVNFGGPTKPKPGDPPATAFLTAVAAGLYAVPPTKEPYPGASLLMSP